MSGRSKHFWPVFLLAPLLMVTPAWAQERGDVTDAVRAARSSGVSDEVLSRLTALGLEHRLPSSQVIQFMDVITTAGREGYPPEPFMEKVEEGMAKRVPPPRILSVLERRLDNYRFARQSIVKTLRLRGGDKAWNPDLLRSIVDALDVGLTRDQVLDFLKNAPAADPAALMLALENRALLGQAGFEEKVALKVLYAGLKNQAFTEEWRALAPLMVMARQRGMTEKEIGRRVLDDIQKGSDFNQVSDDLGFTRRNLQTAPGSGKNAP